MPANNLVVENLFRVEDISSAEMCMMVGGEQRPAMRKRRRVIVDIHHTSIRLDSLGHLVSVLRRGQSSPAVKELNDASLPGNESSNPYQKVPLIPHKSVYLRCNLLMDNHAVDLVVVRTSKGCVIDSGDARFRRVNVS